MGRKEGTKGKTANIMSSASNHFPNGNPYMLLKIEEHHGKFFNVQRHKLKTSKANMGEVKLIHKADVLLQSSSSWGLLGKRTLAE